MNKQHTTPVPEINEEPMMTVMSPDGEPLTELSKRREIIKSAVDAAANGVMNNIKALRAQLDELESLVLQNAARVSD